MPLCVRRVSWATEESVWMPGGVSRFGSAARLDARVHPPAATPRVLFHISVSVHFRPGPRTARPLMEAAGLGRPIDSGGLGSPCPRSNRDTGTQGPAAAAASSQHLSPGQQLLYWALPGGPLHTPQHPGCSWTLDSVADFPARLVLATRPRLATCTSAPAPLGPGRALGPGRTPMAPPGQSVPTPGWLGTPVSWPTLVSR